MISLQHFLIASVLLFAVGVAGVVGRKNLFIVFMSIELMLNAVNLSFVAFARFLNQLDGHIYVFLVMAVAAAEAAIGLAIVILLFKGKESLNVDDFSVMKQ
jgi:NADH-quinone oxidoreductase subunit K